MSEHTAAVIVDIEVTNPAAYAEYISRITPSVLARGGRYLVRGGQPETLDGDWHSSRIVVMLFPTRDIAKDWLHDPELKEIHDMRRNNANRCNMIVCDTL